MREPTDCGTSDRMALRFPASKEEISTDEGKFLYDISTEIPDSYKGAAEKNGFSYKSGARGLICQCDKLTHFF